MAPAPARFAVLAAIAVAAVLAGLSAGPYRLSMQQLADAVRGGPTTPSPEALVFWRLRLPRVAAGFLVGMALAAAGATYQNMFRNPLVSPDVLGVSAGAGFGAALAMYLGLPLVAIQAASFGCGLLAVGVVMGVSARVRSHDPVLVLVLAGVAVGTLFSAGISLIKVLADPTTQLPSIVFWLLGGLNGAAGDDLAMVAPLVAVGLLPMVLLRWRVNLLLLSDEEAVALGVDIRRLRHGLILGATLTTAAVVALAGVVGWVGLVVPHAARLLVGSEYSRLLPSSLVLGGAFLVVADALARTVAPVELPLGILTATVGAPSFLWLLAHTGRGR